MSFESLPLHHSQHPPHVNGRKRHQKPLALRPRHLKTPRRIHIASNRDFRPRVPFGRGLRNEVIPTFHRSSNRVTPDRRGAGATVGRQDFRMVPSGQVSRRSGKDPRPRRNLRAWDRHRRDHHHSGLDRSDSSPGNPFDSSRARFRPKSMETLQTQDWTIGWQAPFPWLQGWEGWIDRSLQSFPSGHTAAAAALATCLSLTYPKACWWFAILATLAGLQRIESGAHFPSDVLAGAAVGIACGSFTMRLGKRKKRSSSQGHAT